MKSMLEMRISRLEKLLANNNNNNNKKRRKFESIHETKYEDMFLMLEELRDLFEENWPVTSQDLDIKQKTEKLATVRVDTKIYYIIYVRGYATLHNSEHANLGRFDSVEDLYEAIVKDVEESW